MRIPSQFQIFQIKGKALFNPSVAGICMQILLGDSPPNPNHWYVERDSNNESLIQGLELQNLRKC